MNTIRLMVLAGLCATAVAVPAEGQDKAKLPAPTPAVRIVLGTGDASANPYRHGHSCAAQTGGGDITVTQPAPHMLVVTMTGAALAKGHLTHESASGWAFDLAQQFEVVAPKDVKVKMTIESRVIGQLRSTACCCPKGATTADVGNAHASISMGDQSILAIDIPGRAVSWGDNQIVYSRQGPVCQVVPAACYTLHQTFAMGARVNKCPLACKAVSADFSPERSFDPAYYGMFDALGATPTRENGYRVTIRVAPEQ